MAMPMISDFVETTVSEIGPSMVGQKVRVTTTLSPSDMAACTQMFCDTTDPCCNSCNTGLYMGRGSIPLYTNDGVTPLDCSGTNCDYLDNCTYGPNDNVMVQGIVEISEYNEIAIAVEMHCREGYADNSFSTSLLGSDKDEHGCIASAGYTWCNEAQDCVRVWETPCSTCSMEGCLDG